MTSDVHQSARNVVAAYEREGVYLCGHESIPELQRKLTAALEAEDKALQERDALERMLNKVRYVLAGDGND
jgi:5'-deoxynucleotidase YfbR-like HD superfamily hydrolase